MQAMLAQSGEGFAPWWLTENEASKRTAIVNRQSASKTQTPAKTREEDGCFYQTE